MGGVVSGGVDNDELVDKLKGADYIRSPNVEKVFRLVDRGYYLTKENQNVAYSDNAWRSGNLHISAPCIYAQVMEGLQLGAGMSFLNLGSGTGYLSTMAGLLLGPEGINHGVEIYGDVVAYARDRLSWFINNSGAIDVCMFCEPQFVQGNALCLSEDIIMYDRVYCGASCPGSHENYMKNLLKVNGVLVMPRNDQLLKITRINKMEWTAESLLPVSFSSLIMPERNYNQSCVKLPAVNIASLQELSRHVIRRELRSSIESETQGLKDAFIHTIPPSMHKGQSDYCRVRRIFPNITFSDDDSDMGEDRDTLYDAQRETASQITAFLDLARSLAMNRNFSEDSNDATGREENYGEGLDSAITEEVDGEAEEVDGEVAEELELPSGSKDTNADPSISIDRNSVEVKGEAKMDNETQNRVVAMKDQSDLCSDNGVVDENGKIIVEDNDKMMVDNIDKEIVDENGKLNEDNGNKEMEDGNGKLMANANDKEMKEDNGKLMMDDNNMEDMEFDDSFVEDWLEGRLHSLQNWARLRKSTTDTPVTSTDQSHSLSVEKAEENDVRAGSNCDNCENEDSDGNVQLSKSSKLSECRACSHCKKCGHRNGKESCVKKREKFDSGIGDEIENSRKNEDAEDDDRNSVSSSSTASALSCSFPSSSSSESEHSDHDENVSSFENDSKCECEKEASTNGRKFKVRRSRRRRSHRPSTHRIKREPREKGDEPVEKYSSLMQQKIRQLPLPVPLKVYVNYCRPL